MKKSLIARVFVEKTTIGFDKAFDYSVPFDMAGKVFVGQRVVVPFGRGNRKLQGIIVELAAISETDCKKVKPVLSLVDQQSLLSEEMLRLAAFMKEHYFCTYFEAIRPMLPPGINVQIIASYAYDEQADQLDASALSEDEKAIVTALQKSKAAVKKERLLEIFGLDENTPVLENLVQKGFITRLDNAVRRVGDATVKMVRLCDEQPEETPQLTPKQKQVYDFLEECGAASLKEVQYFTGVTQAVVQSLVKKGVAQLFENEVYRNPYAAVGPGEKTEIHLSQEQNAAYQGLLKQMQNCQNGDGALLYGVTGSGKTQVFLKLIDEVEKTGKGVILMVPEIALTPQTLRIFQSRYGSKIAVFHSAMSLGQRTDEWKRIKNGDASIAIGTRSAIFAPFEKIGLIIMDEEQEHTYKSESTPRFHARDIAKFRCKAHNCLFLMASATPSVETFTIAKTGRIPMYVMKKRFGNVRLPVVKTVNMKEQYAKGNFGILSDTLTDALSKTLQQKKQSILLLNRRGYHVFVSCRNCGHVRTCPNCSISLTYHAANNRMMCHYCGYSEPFSDTCQSCGDKNIKLSGYGTQKVEEELALIFKNARILRMDADTTMTRFSHERKLNAFAAGEYDIMVGTQMVAKGLDFPNVTLVGVINADQSLYSDDFRSSEKTFSLLTQVIGRSGRGDTQGTAIIQTISPDSEIIWLSAKQDYDAFYATEILARKLLVYPPYCDLAVIGFAGVVKERVQTAANLFFEHLKSELCGEYQDLKVIILGPSACSVPKVSNKYRFRLILKCKNNHRLREMLMQLLQASMQDFNFKNISVFADINPETIL